MKIIIGSEAKGDYIRDGGNNILPKLFKLVNKDITIEWQNTDKASMIIRSNFPPKQKLWNNKSKKYIYWSGESFYTGGRSKHSSKHMYILTHFINGEDGKFIYLPYCIYSSYIYQPRINTTLDRLYLVGYCYSNKVPFREELFNKFIEHDKGSVDICKAFGGCFGKYPKSHMKKSGTWHNFDSAMEGYKQCKFVLALENKYTDGYITEKIVNAFHSGAIPIYKGSKNINELFNEKAFINIDDFETVDECVEHVVNMTDEERQTMLSENILNKTSDLINIFNPEYEKNNNNTNEIRKKYTEIIRTFLS
jgi:hypothetical protein